MARKKRQKRQIIPGLAFSNETVLRPADERDRMIRELADSDATLNICLTNDFAFKTAFRNKKALTGLLSALLDMDPQQIADLEFPDTFVRGDYPEDREGILDIKVHLNSQKKINLEMQLLSFPYWEELQRLGLLHYNSASAPGCFLKHWLYHKINVTLPVFIPSSHRLSLYSQPLYPHRRLCIICPGKLRIVEFAVDDKTGIPISLPSSTRKASMITLGVKAFSSPGLPVATIRIVDSPMGRSWAAYTGKRLDLRYPLGSFSIREHPRSISVFISTSSTYTSAVPAYAVQGEYHTIPVPQKV